MSQCPFCGSKEEKNTPLCHACGAIRYPVDKKPTVLSAQEKLKLSAVVAAAIVTPGSLFVLALASVARFTRKK